MVDSAKGCPPTLAPATPNPYPLPCFAVVTHHSGEEERRMQLRHHHPLKAAALARRQDPHGTRAATHSHPPPRFTSRDVRTTLHLVNHSIHLASRAASSLASSRAASSSPIPPRPSKPTLTPRPHPPTPPTPSPSQPPEPSRSRPMRAPGSIWTSALTAARSSSNCWATSTRSRSPEAMPRASRAGSPTTRSRAFPPMAAGSSSSATATAARTSGSPTPTAPHPRCSPAG